MSDNSQLFKHYLILPKTDFQQRPSLFGKMMVLHHHHLGRPLSISNSKWHVASPCKHFGQEDRLMGVRPTLPDKRRIHTGVKCMLGLTDWTSMGQTKISCKAFLHRLWTLSMICTNNKSQTFFCMDYESLPPFSRQIYAVGPCDRNNIHKALSCFRGWPPARLW